MNLKKNTRNGRAARRCAAERRAAHKRDTRLRRKRERLRVDQIATQAFQKHNWEQVYRFPQVWCESLREELRPICMKAPLLLEPDFGDMLEYIAYKDRLWLNALDAWKPRGQTPQQQLISLVDHLFVRYPVPQFLYEPFFRKRKDRTRLDLFLYLSRGGSMARYIKNGRFPLLMTKRMCHEFLNSPHQQFQTALRTAQVKGHGGSEALGLALCRQWLGGGLCCKQHEGQRDRAIQWLCRQPDFPEDELEQFSAWVRANGANISWRGRTVASVLRLTREWDEGLRRRAAESLRRTLEQNGTQLKTPFPSPGLQPLHRSNWSIEEIRTPFELQLEGETMRHCVAGYVEHALRGESSFWSFRRDGARFLTIQVKVDLIVQVRGKRNRKVDPKEWILIREWAKVNELRIGHGQ